MKAGRKLNNQGLSLIELIVALAVSTIILSAVTLLVTNGVSGYNKQTTQSTLQDDANLTMNHLTNAIMEANYIDISNENADGTVNTNVFVTNDGSGGLTSNQYVFDASKNTLYVAEKGSSDLSPLCTNVEGFTVQLTKDSLRHSNAEATAVAAGVGKVVQVKITLKLEYNNTIREVTRYTNVRNVLNEDTLKVDGNSVIGLGIGGELRDYLTE